MLAGAVASYVWEHGAARGEAVRKDDDPEVFKQRLEAYNRDTAVVVPFYDKNGLLTVVDGMQSIDEVTAAIEAVLSGLDENV